MVVKILDNCCSPDYLTAIKNTAALSKNWNLHSPAGKEISIDEKYLSLDIIRNGVQHPFLAGLALGLLIQIYEAGGQGLFIPEMWFCHITMKDKQRTDHIHTDNEKKDNIVKILGILNSDWEEKWGGGFVHD